MNGNTVRNVGFQAAAGGEKPAAKAQERMLEIPEKEATAMLRNGDTLGLEKMGKTAIPFLERMAREGRHQKIRENAIFAIQMVGDKSSIPVLAGVMGDEKEFANVRIAAASAISRLGDASSISLFHQVLRRKKPDKKSEGSKAKKEPEEAELPEALYGECLRGMIECQLKDLVERLLDEEKRR